MSYTTGTTHYNLPQTVGSDKRDWFDTNEAFAEVDTALYGAVQDTAQAGLDITALQSDVSTINGKLSTDEGNITTLQGKVSSLESTVASQSTELTDVRRDLQDNIESNHEATATSTHAYAVGDYFFYNDVLYKATAIIGVGDTIVPNTNCTGVTVMSELEAGGSGTVTAEDVTFDNTTSRLTADNVQEAIDEVVGMIPATSDQLVIEEDSSPTLSHNHYHIPDKAGYIPIATIVGSPAGTSAMGSIVYTNVDNVIGYYIYTQNATGCSFVKTVYMKL